MKSFKEFLTENQLVLRTDGHYDVHGLTPDHIEWIRSHPQVLNNIGHITLTLPENLDPLPNALVGPSAGDPPIHNDDPRVYMQSRGGGRNYPSKMISGPHRFTRMITVVTRQDPKTGNTILHTAYGGPGAMAEPNNPELPDEQRKASENFWSQHALLDGKKPE